ncbi:GNAT family N-acetyltransferase [Baekduia soli]|uniref:GNAT family N-acetyltransferase n=1 Tax=Baekduia soli TaxID=496014 RepID=A0A5B8UB17_9ACTN|nr:GNAT family N-acetyltransferase [Baekduia soli]QEC50197.1 GNAT family N-acetyltransferase [Baekduia soli]
MEARPAAGPFAFRREAAADPHERIWLLDVQGRAVGRCRTAPASASGDDGDLGTRAAVILELAIDPGHRRRGLGRRLIGHAVNDLLVRSHAPVLAWVDGGDPGALAFLGRHGFRPDGTARPDGAVRVVRRR